MLVCDVSALLPCLKHSAPLWGFILCIEQPAIIASRCVLLCDALLSSTVSGFCHAVVGAVSLLKAELSISNASNPFRRRSVLPTVYNYHQQPTTSDADIFLFVPLGGTMFCIID